jgi:hypothetical protein
MLRIAVRQTWGFYPARRAALLLLVLLGHLALMASMLHDGPSSQEVSVSAPVDHATTLSHCPECTPLHAEPDGSEHSTDCALESAPPAGHLKVRLVTGLAAVAWLDPPESQPAPQASVRRALQPFRLCPSQAFLQVFRN